MRPPVPKPFMYMRSLWPDRARLEGAVVRSLLELLGLKDYTNHAQTPPSPDQLVLDPTGKSYREIEAVGPGSQHAWAEMDRVIERIKGDLLSNPRRHLSGYTLEVHCEERQLSRREAERTARNVLDALADPHCVEFSEDQSSANIRLQASSRDFIRSMGLKKHSPNPDGSARAGVSLEVAAYLGAALPRDEAIALILSNIYEKVSNTYTRVENVPLDLLIHNTGFSDVRWEPHSDFLNQLERRVRSLKPQWQTQFNEIYLLTENDYREVK